MSVYKIKFKDPIIDVMRALIDLRASMEGKAFGKILRDIERETDGEIKYATLYGWFVGPTRYPRYCTVARLYISMRAYCRKPVVIGDTNVNALSLVKRRRAA
jgi:hypothetical protein